MARNTIKYLLKQELQKQASYGRSKHEDKISTYKKRNEQKVQGVPYADRQETNDFDGHIYSFLTMKTYQQQVGYYGDFLIKNGHKNITLEESKQYIQSYLDFLQNNHYSPWSINTALAAICKATGLRQKDFSHPTRTISKIERGNTERMHDSVNATKASKILDANRLLGMRRSELKALKASDIIIRDDKVVVKSIGKGGRYNEQIFTLPIEKEKVLEFKKGKSSNDKIFNIDDFRNDADLHHARQMRAIDVYNHVVDDMKKNPARRDYYQREIKQIYLDRNKILRENLDNPYCVRGINRQRLLNQGREVTYDRTALVYVSVTVLNHTRADVSCQHYIAK